MSTLAGVTLPSGIMWSDRGEYSPVVQSTRRTLSGKLVVYPGALVKGMPITLESLRDQGWMQYTDVLQVKSLADSVGGEYDLTLNGELMRVMFRHQEAPAFEYKPLISRAQPLPDDWFLVTIKLMTV